MKTLSAAIIIIIMALNPVTIFDFSKSSDISSWRVEDDVVMGGRSSGHFELTREGHGHFYGQVSLENDGGFSSVELKTDPVSVTARQFVVLRIKGSGERYQFRFRKNATDNFAYIHHFQTSGEWEEIRLPLSAFKPHYRGRDLDLPDFSGDQLISARFLIANKKAQEFSLLIDYIRIEPAD